MKKDFEVMKIVHIITRLILGGAQENTLITCREQSRRGHDVTLITGPAVGPEGRLIEQAQKESYRLIVIDSMRREINPLPDITSYMKIKHHLSKIVPDVVHTHSAKAGILGRLAGFALKKKTDRAVKPIVVHTIHGLAFHPYQNKMINRFYKAIERFTAERTDAFISVAEAMTKKALAAGMGNESHYSTAYSAIDEEGFLALPTEQDIKDFRRQYGINEQAVVIVCVARLAELKGHDYIVESAKKIAPEFENCIWLFVGDGKLKEQIRHKIQLAGLGYRFKFTGLLPPERIPMAVHASDILVHCSLREGLARVLPQAMLCRKPVVSFDIDGAREIVNERTGFLIEPKDIEALTNACRKLITEPELCRELGEAGRESVIEKFSPRKMVDTIEEVYTQTIDRKRRQTNEKL